MQGDDAVEGKFLWHGPRMWAISAAAGALIGAGLGVALPPGVSASGGYVLAPWTIAPFVVLLLSIAVAPLVNERWWHRHYPDVSFVLGALVAAYYAVALSKAGPGPLTYGLGKIMHSAVEYYGFIALVGGLYVASGGILVGLRGRAGPASNTILLAIGAVLANFVGTTGASVLLVRPFMRSNEGRLRPLHVVFFIIIVSNCGGVLTPIGDPPLYLGYLKGVPFFWVPMAMWSSWLVVVLPLLAIFFVYDMGVLRRDRATSAALAAALEPAAVLPSITLGGRPVSFVLMGLIVAAVFIDPALQRIWHVHLPVGPTVQIVLALVALRVARRDVMEANEFSWEAVKEVGLLFAGIFLTMMPALAYLSANGKALGLTSPSAFYWATGALSAVLDNAPTYLNFVQLAVTPAEVDRASIAELLSTPAGQRTLEAISAGAVFFGALTYIGNGPNFMVRTIAMRAGVEMPSFFGYAARAMLILGPVLVLHWIVRVW